MSDESSVCVVVPDTNEKENQIEKELVEEISLIKNKNEIDAKETNAKISALEIELKRSRIECEVLKRKLAIAEKEGKQKNSPSSSFEVERIRQKQDDLLTKAKDLLFEKTKVSKQQEQKIEILNCQIISLKDVASISKEMLELRNVENQHIHARLETIELRLKAEKERQLLYEKKLSITQQMYNDLKKEYDIQSSLFTDLKKSYQEKLDILTAELDGYKEHHELNKLKFQLQDKLGIFNGTKPNDIDKEQDQPEV